MVISHPLDFHLVGDPPQFPQLILIEQSQTGRLHMVVLDAINFCLQQLVALLQRTHLEQPHSTHRLVFKMLKQKEKREKYVSEGSYLLDVHSKTVIEGDHLLFLTGACAEESLILSGCSVQIHRTAGNPKTHAQTQRSHTHTAVQGHKTYIYYVHYFINAIFFLIVIHKM